MRNAKKVLSVVMAILMLVSVVALGAYALDADTVCELKIECDKTSYAAGDDVTLTVYGKTNACAPEIEAAGQYILAYQDAGLEPYSTSDNLVSGHGFVAAPDHASGYDNGSSQAILDDVMSGMTTNDTGADYKLLGIYVGETSDTYVSSTSDYVPLFSFKMKVASTAADGDYYVTFNRAGMEDWNGYVNYQDSVNGLQDMIAGDDNDAAGTFGLTHMWSFIPATIHVGAAGPVVAHKQAQVKMTLNEGKTGLAEVAKPIQLRVISVITAADFDAYFSETTKSNKETASDKNAITSVGIVAYKGAKADFNEATAKALVTDGTAAGPNYQAAVTDYISNASGDYTFGAIIRGSFADAFASDVTYLGFVKYLDASGKAQVIFYETAVSKTITTDTVDAYIAAQNA